MVLHSPSPLESPLDFFCHRAPLNSEGGGIIGPPLSFEKNPVIIGQRRNSKIDLEDF